jgi:hypothetical protein
VSNWLISAWICSILSRWSESSRFALDSYRDSGLCCRSFPWWEVGVPKSSLSALELSSSDSEPSSLSDLSDEELLPARTIYGCLRFFLFVFSLSASFD